MRVIISVFFIVFFLSACETMQHAGENIYEKSARQVYEGGFQPVQPMRYDPGKYQNEEIPVSCVSGKTDKIKKDCWLDTLVNSEDFVAIRNVTYSVSAGFGPATGSFANSQYEIVSQWARFINIAPFDNTLGAKIQGEEHKLGVGARIVANITTKTAGINLGDLFAVAAAAEAGKVDGSLLFTIQGIHGKGVDTYTPRVSKLDQESLRKALDAIQNIKTLLHNDDSIKLNGQIIAIKKVMDEQQVQPGEKGDLVKAGAPVKRQGWVYVGEFNSSGAAIGVTYLSVTNLRELSGSVSVRTDLNVRDSYPKLPSYILGGQLDVLKAASVVTVAKYVKTVGDKTWAFIEY